VRTDDLILRIADDARPVHRLGSPWKRTLLWLGIALPYAALVVFVMSPRPDLAGIVVEPRFQIEQTAVLATAVLAAFAAFSATIPGRRRRVLLLPLLPLTIWLGSLGQGCVSDWLRYGVESLVLRPDWACFPSIAIVGAVPAAVIVTMLRRGAPLLPFVTVALGALAAAALGNFGLRFFHAEDASLMVLVWQFGSVAVIVACAGWMGRRILGWRHLQPGR